jgi:hypothetical protein
VSDAPDIARIVAGALSQFLAQSSPDPLGLRQLAADLHAMPLYCCWFRCLAIRPSGEIISFDIESYAGVQPPGDVRIVDDQLTRNMALCQGARNDPALQILVPNKPPDAVECSLCAGKGVLPEPAANMICSCGGLGWLPPDSKPGDYKF